MIHWYSYIKYSTYDFYQGSILYLNVKNSDAGLAASLTDFVDILTMVSD